MQRVRIADGTPVGVEQHRVAALQRALRRQQFEPGLTMRQAGLRTVQRGAHGARQCGLDALQRGAFARGVRPSGCQPHRQQPLHVLGALHAAMQGEAQAPLQMRQPGAPFAHLRLRTAQAAGQPVDRLGAAVQLPAQRRGQRVPAERHIAQHAGAVGADQFGGAGRRGRAHVGDEIDDGDVGLVADARHDGKVRCRHGARDRLFVEGPQVFDAAAAPAQDDHIDFRPRVDDVEHGRDPFGRAGALHRYGIDHHRHMRRAPAQRGQHIPQRRRLQRGHHPDRMRMAWQRALARRVEQPLRLQRGLEPQEGLVQIAQAGPADGLDAQLQFAARLVQRDHGTHLDRLPLARREIGVLVASLEHHATDLRAGILEREIPVPAARAGEVRDFASDPAEREVALQQPGDAPVDLGDRQHLLPASHRCSGRGGGNGRRRGRRGGRRIHPEGATGRRRRGHKVVDPAQCNGVPGRLLP